ncbi:hypothetical protein [Limnoraphis robusta]|uniref:hypothetical protein n=1 Tax=Limnoraphis robusta TaxID=1118279 RepID=UPI002B21A573|nr:hypothetical protein [Limnoraphis robusta]MEA5498013.1 hypothetical protein [Limnoraphis robusta BA-68 BA1]
MEVRQAIAVIISESSKTQAEWARQSGLSPQNLNDYLQSRRDLVGENIQKILWTMDESERLKFAEFIAQNGKK